jgi:hypothetical protein
MPPGLPPRRTDSTGYLFGLRGSIWRSTEAANVRSGLLPPSSFLPARCLTGFDVFGGGFSYLLVLTVILRCGRSPNPTPTYIRVAVAPEAAAQLMPAIHTWSLFKSGMVPIWAKGASTHAYEGNLAAHFFDVAAIGNFAALRHPQYPPLDLRHRAFRRRQGGLEERGKCTVPVGAGEPAGDAVGIVLVPGAVCAGEAAAPPPE